MWLFACLWLERVHIFFPTIFSTYLCSVNACFVCIVPCNQSSVARFIQFSSRCIDASMLFWMLASPFPSWHIQSVYIIIWMLGLMHTHVFSCYLIHFLKFCFGHFKNDPEYPMKRTALWWDLSYVVSFRVVFLFSWGIFFNLFVSSPHVWWCPL